MAPQRFDQEDEAGVSPWIRFVSHSVAGQTPAAGSTGPRALLFASAGPAYAHLLSSLEKRGELLYNGHVYECGSWHTEHSVWDVLIFEIERDASMPAFVRARLIKQFQPDLVFLLQDLQDVEGTDAPLELSGQQETARLVSSAAQILAALEAYDCQQRKEVQTSSQESPLVSGPTEIFYSYAGPDEIWRQRLSQQLAVLRRSGQISEWGTRQQALGLSQQEHLRHLERAQVILLLVSADYLDSDRCHMEASRAVQRLSSGQARVLPILVHPVTDLSETPFGDLEALPRDGRSLASARNPDDLLQKVAGEISELVRRIRDRESGGQLWD